MRLGLRARLLLVLAVVLVATVALAKVVIGPVVRASLVRDLVDATRLRAAVIADIASITMGPTAPFEDPVRQVALQTLVDRIGRLLGGGGGVEVVADRLRVLASSTGAAGGSFLPDDAWRLANLGAAPASRVSGDRAEAIAPVPLRAADGRVPAVPRPPALWVVVAAPLDPTAATAGRMEELILLYLSGAAVLLLLTGYALLTSRILRPIGALAEAVTRVGQGEPSAGAPVGDDELGRLGAAFNRMVAELETRRAEREARIAELVRARDETAAAREETVRAEKLAVVGRLAAGVAHEVGNPLQAMLGYAELLIDDARATVRARDYEPTLDLTHDSSKAPAMGARGPGASEPTLPDAPRPPAEPTFPGQLEPGQRLDMLRRMHKDIERIKAIVGDLVAYARPVRQPPEAVDLDLLLDGAAALLRVEPRFKRVQLRRTTTATPAAPVRALASPGPLEQVAVNLLLNAADAVESKGEAGVVEAGAAPGPGAAGTVCFWVRDNGAGVRPEDAPHLFDPFFTTKEPGRGTGLGLAISHRLIDEFGGRIEVETAPDGGALFRVVLPASTAPRAQRAE